MWNLLTLQAGHIILLLHRKYHTSYIHDIWSLDASWRITQLHLTVGSITLSIIRDFTTQCVSWFYTAIRYYQNIYEHVIQWNLLVIPPVSRDQPVLSYHLKIQLHRNMQLKLTVTSIKRPPIFSVSSADKISDKNIFLSPQMSDKKFCITDEN